MDYIAALNNLTAADAMDVSPPVLNYEGNLEDALRMIADENRQDVAVGAGKDIAGFVHAQDITGILARGESIDVPLRTFLDSCSLSGSKPCIQVRPEESLIRCLWKMVSEPLLTRAGPAEAE